MQIQNLKSEVRIMLFGQSIAIVSPASFVMGTVIGHYLDRYLEKQGFSLLQRELATGFAHWAASKLTGYIISVTLGMDVTGTI
jgi:hypothetical protein